MEGTRMRPFLGCAGIVVAAALAAGVALYLLWGPAVAPGVGTASGWQLQGLDGTELDVADLKGKVVFLNLWATWCPPCRAEMPSIQRLYEKMKDEGVAFALVSHEAPKTVRKFVEESGYTMPIYTAAGAAPPAFQTRAIPTTFVIGRDGKIALRQVGAKDWNDEDTVSLLRRLLTEEPPAATATLE